MMGFYGGGRAVGGPTRAGVLYEVAENGRPEIYRSAGRTFLLGGEDGYVEPAGRAAASSVGAGTLHGTAASGLVVNIYNSQGDKVQASAKQSQGKGGMPQLDIFVDSIEKKIAGNVAKGQGPLNAAMRARYNLNPAVNA